ncbi:hypothetical protein [Shewanella acanthi]|uniref:hypothetical protein n=1 Tax=Shewanella acanthi TaxID=2864212 RepID=UPI001C65727A|nr:hypothetical protein [Shewanella acanthi]QYJ77921.1 hypothetical protein K0H61_12425 [Shewanella acanthi]
MEKSLARYKTSESNPLELSYPMEFLQDKIFCSALIEDLEAFSDGWERIQNLSSNSSALIPDRKGVYMFVWRPSIEFKLHNESYNFRFVVYVGAASKGESSILSRFNSDYKSLINKKPSVHWTENNPHDRESRLRKVLNLWDLEYWYATMDNASSEQILDIEKRLINVFNPPGNKSFKQQIRAKIDIQKKTPAFEPAF